jgi:antitoxin YefM
MDLAIKDREIVIVRRRKGDAVAMIAADELSSLMETAHLLRSPKNAERLLSALGRSRQGKGEPLFLDALKIEVGLAK